MKIAIPTSGANTITGAAIVTGATRITGDAVNLSSLVDSVATYSISIVRYMKI